MLAALFLRRPESLLRAKNTALGEQLTTKTTLQPGATKNVNVNVNVNEEEALTPGPEPEPEPECEPEKEVSVYRREPISRLHHHLISRGSSDRRSGVLISY